MLKPCVSSGRGCLVMSARWPMVFVFGLCLLLLGALFSLYERYEETVDTGWTTEARLNPYLAGQRYLEALGMVVESSDSLERIASLDDVGTVFISGSSRVLTERKTDALMAWVEAGGHVILAPDDATSSKNDVLLSRFDLQLESECSCNHDTHDKGKETTEELSAEPIADSESEAQDNELGTEENEAQEDEKFSDQLRDLNERIRRGEFDNLLTDDIPFNEEDIAVEDITILEFEGVPGTISAHFKPTRYLSWISSDEEPASYRPEMHYAVGSEHGIHLAQLVVGEGLLTVISDSTVWTSGYIEHFDHAFLLWNLSGNGDKFLFLYGQTMPALSVLLWRYGPEAIIATIVLILAWLFSYRGRLGPVLEPRYEVRRTLFEYLQANAHFLWDNQEQGVLVQALRDDINKRAAQLLPGYEQLAADQQLKQLAQHTDLSPAVLSKLLSQSKPEDEASFTRQVRALKTIREKL